MATVAEANNFLFVYPCGFKGLLGVAWNAGTCCLRGSKVNDVNFTLTMITEIKENFHVNASRIFSSGFSNGGMMTEVLMCQVAPHFAGAAFVSSVVEMDDGNNDGLEKCDQSFQTLQYTLPMLHVHGDTDDVVPWTGDAILGFPTVPDDYQRWANRSNCTGTPVVGWTNGPYSSQMYVDCPNAAFLELVRHHLGSHEWPIDQYFNATAYIWEFFNSVMNGQKPTGDPYKPYTITETEEQ